MSVIGDKFKECRLEKGLSLIEVAASAGVSESEVFRIETGRRKNPSASILVKIGKVLGFANDDVLRLAGLKNDDGIPLIEKVFPDLKTEKQQTAAKRIMHKLSSDKNLQDDDIDDLLDQLEMFLDFVEKKRNPIKNKI